MAFSFYKGATPLLGQPRYGNGKVGRAYVGGQLAYGAAPAGVEPITDNLTQWFDAVNASSLATYMADASGNGNNGTDESGGTFTWNSSGYVSIASTGDDQYIETGIQPTWLGDWTLEVWAEVISVDNGQGISLVGNREAGGGNFFIMAVNEGSDEGEIYWVSNNESAISPTQDPVFDGSFHQFTAVHDYNTDTLYLYIDGAEIGTASTAGNTAPSRGTNPGLDLMGNYLSRYFDDAKLGTYRAYSAALTQAEVQQNFDADKAHYGL